MKNKKSFIAHISEIAELIGSQYLFSDENHLEEIFSLILVEMKESHFSFKYEMTDVCEEHIEDFVDNESNNISNENIGDIALKNEVLMNFILGENLLELYEDTNRKIIEIYDLVDEGFWRELAAFMVENGEVRLLKPEDIYREEFLTIARALLDSDSRFYSKSMIVEFEIDLQPSIGKLKEEIPELYEFLNEKDLFVEITQKMKDLKFRKDISISENQHIYTF